MVSRLLWIFAVVTISSGDSDGKKWVWGASERSGDSGERTYTGLVSGSGSTKALVSPSSGSLFRPSSGKEEVISQSTRLRYEVSELELENPRPPARPTNYPEEEFRPQRPTNRPDNFRPRPTNSGATGPGFGPSTLDNSNVYRPNNNRPNGGYRPPENSYKPDNFRPGQGPGYRPQSGFGPVDGPGGRPVLTGPEPSWNQREDRYQDYNKCKCVLAFNCNSPGIVFGHCDRDKKYCCYKDGLNHHREESFNKPHFGNTGGSRPVLAGPDGPRDRPSYYQTSLHNSNRYDGPNRYPENNRYSNRHPDNGHGSSSLEEAYKRGLESAIHETVQALTGFNSREFLRDYDEPSGDFNRRPTSGGYGLYQSSDLYGGRSLNSTILSEKKG